MKTDPENVSRKVLKTNLIGLPDRPCLESMILSSDFQASLQDKLLESATTFRRRKTVATTGRSYGGPSEKFVGGFEGDFQKLPPNFSEVAFMWKSPDAMHFRATSQKFPSEPPELLRSCSRSPPCCAYSSSPSYTSSKNRIETWLGPPFQN